MNETLLDLLKKEDRLVRDLQSNIETYMFLARENPSSASCKKYEIKMKESNDALLNCRERISEYVKFYIFHNRKE